MAHLLLPELGAFVEIVEAADESVAESGFPLCALCAARAALLLLRLLVVLLAANRLSPLQQQIVRR